MTPDELDDIWAWMTTEEARLDREKNPDAHTAKKGEHQMNDFMHKAIEAEMRSFTTMRAPLTVEEGEEHWLYIDGADRPWFFDTRCRAFYWVDRGVSPSTWLPYLHEDGKWETVANAYEITSRGAYEGVDVAEVWREITDPRELALLAAIEKAVQAHLGVCVSDESFHRPDGESFYRPTRFRENSR